MIRPLITTTVALALLAGQAAALTCVPPDPARSWASAVGAVEEYVVLSGTLDFDDSLMPQGIENDPPPPGMVPAHFVGRQLGADGSFSIPLDRQVQLQPVCLGPWCGSLTSGHEILAFAQRDGGTLEISLDPCGAWHFADPEPMLVSRIEQCAAGGPCTPSR